MSRTAFISGLVKKFSTHGESLAYPDHPLLLNGPSVLSLTDGALKASFVYTRHSRPVSSLAEQARILLARLAYPGRTEFEGIFEHGSLINGEGIGLFDSFRVGTVEVLSGSDRIEAPGDGIQLTIGRLKEVHFERFAANQQGVIEQPRRGTRASFEEFARHASLDYKFVDRGPQSISAHIPVGKRGVTLRRVERVAETFVASDYGLGLGLSALADLAGAFHESLYLEQHSLYVGFPFAGGRKSGDHAKPLRAAQFGGGLVEQAW